MNSNSLRKPSKGNASILIHAYPTVIVGFLIMFYSTALATHIMQVCYLLMLAGLPFALIKKGHTPIVQDRLSPKYSAGKWFALIILAQAAQLVVFQGMSLAFTNTILEHSPPGTVLDLQATLFSHPYWLLLSWLGALGIISYFSPIKISKMHIFPIIKIFYPEGIKRLPTHVVGGYFTFRMSTFLCLSIPLIALLTELTKILMRFYGFQVAINQPLLIFILFVLVYPIMLNKSIKTLATKLWRLKPSLGLVTAFLIPFLILVLFGYNALVTHFGLDTLIKPQNYSNSRDILFFQVFAWTWWLSCSSLLVFYVLRISEGRTLRQICIGVIAAPLIFQVLFYEKPIVIHSPWLIMLSISTIILYVLCCSDLKNLLLSAILYKPPSHQHSLPVFLARGWVFNMIVCLFTYLIWGTFLLVGVLFVPVCYLVGWISLGLLRRYKSRPSHDSLAKILSP